ncbi:hypothetical protein PQQ65_31180 [Paraburkholderia strydomiana]|uniref:hypothetical protein n=1 Tax=Paraburkholderia strydomiana TaxID=1245417 RepID=UPI0038BB7A6F
MAVFVSAIASEVLQLGWDSLVAGIVLGVVISSWRTRAAMAAMFGVCDGAAALLGRACLPRAFDLPDIVPLMFLMVIVALAMRGRRGFLWISPVLFCVDNFFSFVPPAHASLLACASALLAWSGLCAGGLMLKAAGAMLHISRSGDVRPSRDPEHASCSRAS